MQNFELEINPRISHYNLLILDSTQAQAASSTTAGIDFILSSVTVGLWFLFLKQFLAIGREIMSRL